MKITNNHNIDIALAVWALQNGYNSGADKAPPGELISATTLLKPTRQLILQRKVDQSAESKDVADFLASRMGHSLHDGVERAWTHGNWQQSMRMLGYPDKVIDRIKINPDPKTLEPGDIPVYLEQRGFLEIDDVVLTGQLDFSIDGAYRDLKTTSTFTYTSGNKDEDYRKQGSLYRLIMPEFIQDDTMRIDFLFTDWQRFRAAQNPAYPQTKAAHREYTLLDKKDTTDLVLDKLNEIRTNARLPQDQMIRCTDKDLWRGKDEYKYYLNPETAKKGGRCSKRFTDYGDAQLYMQNEKGGRGVIITEKAEVKACEYCAAFAVCEQRKEYFN